MHIHPPLVKLRSTRAYVGTSGGSATAWPMNQKITRLTAFCQLTTWQSDSSPKSFLPLSSMEHGQWKCWGPAFCGKALRMGKCKTCCPTQTMQDYSNTIHCYVLFNSSLTPYASLSEPVIATCCCDTPSTPAEQHAVAKLITIQSHHCLSGTSSWGDEAMASNELGHRKRSKKVLPTADMRLHKQIMCDMMTC